MSDDVDMVDMALFMASGFDGFVEDSRVDPKFIADNARKIEQLSQSVRNARTLGHFARMSRTVNEIYEKYREALEE
jgi:hypothetical protein